MRTKQRVLPILAIVLAAVATHAVSLGGGLYFDDLHSVRDNEALADPANFFTAFYDGSLFSSMPGRMYRPSVISTLVLDHWFGAGEVWAFKLTNLWLHVVTALLVRAVALRLRLGSGRAFVAGLLFAVHPLATEAIHGISSRSDQMLALGTLWAVWAAVGPGASKPWRRIQVLLGTALACGAKETGVLIPILLACIALSEQLRAGRMQTAVWIRRAKRLLPVVGLVCAYLVVRSVVLSGGEPVRTYLQADGNPMVGAGRDLVTQWSVMGQVLPRFLAQSFLPIHLSLDPHVDFQASPTSAMVLAGWGSVLLATLFGLTQWRRRPAVAIAVCGIWALSAPWILVPLNSPAMEHRTYGALAFGAIAIVSFLPRGLAVKTPSIQGLRQPIPAALAAMVCTSAALSFDRGCDYLDGRRLWEGVLEHHPASYHAHCGLALLEQDEGAFAQFRGDAVEGERRIRLAESHARKAATRAPFYVLPWSLLTEYRLMLDSPLLAKAYAGRGVDASPMLARSRVQYANALVQAGKVLDRPEWFEEGEAMATECLGTTVSELTIYAVAADAAEQLGEYERAESYYTAAWQKNLRFPELIRPYMEFSVRRGRTQQAQILANHLLMADPGNEAARAVLTPAAPR